MSGVRRPRPRARSEKSATILGGGSEEDSRHDEGSLAESQTGNRSSTSVHPRASAPERANNGSAAGSASPKIHGSPARAKMVQYGQDDFFDRSKRTAKRTKTASFTQRPSSSSSSTTAAAAARAGRSSGGPIKVPVLSGLAQRDDDALGQAFGDGSLSDEEEAGNEGPGQIAPISSDAEEDEDEDEDDLYDEDEAARRRRLAARARRQVYSASMSRLGVSSSSRHRGTSSTTDAQRSGRSQSASATPFDDPASLDKDKDESRLGRLEEEDDDDEDDEILKRPEATKEAIAQIREVIKRNLPVSNVLFEQDEESEMGNEELDLIDLDPDLVQHLEGESGINVRRIQRELRMKKQKEGLSHVGVDQERRRQQNNLGPKDAEASSSSLTRASGSGSIQTKATGAARAPVELSSDTESDAARPIRTRRSSDRSSPAIEIVSVVLKQASNSQAESNQEGAGPALTQAQAESTPSKVEEEVERIAIVMKGGEQGALVTFVQVRPTTTVAKLIAHYVDQHKKVIPARKQKGVKMRFDGDVLAPSDTMQDIGIEDEEQLDVIW